LEREFLRRNAKVEFALGNYEDTPEGEVRKDMDATFAKWENAKRVERCNRGKRGKAEKGLFVGGRTPYAYILDSDGEGGVQIVPEQAKVVELIYHLYAEKNYSLRKIRDELKNRGIPSYTGRPE
jgi:DNA invertase Pin-like site-specific DNA recombinase